MDKLYHLALVAAVGVSVFMLFAIYFELKKQQKRSAQIKQQVDDFLDAVSDFRDLVICNYDSRKEEEKDTKPLEQKITDMFMASSRELKVIFSLRVLEILGRPDECGMDNEHALLQNAMLQKLAFDKFDELKKILQTSLRREEALYAMD